MPNHVYKLKSEQSSISKKFQYYLLGIKLYLIIRF